MLKPFGSRPINPAELAGLETRAIPLRKRKIAARLALLNDSPRFIQLYPPVELLPYLDFFPVFALGERERTLALPVPRCFNRRKNLAPTLETWLAIA